MNGSRSGSLCNGVCGRECLRSVLGTGGGRNVAVSAEPWVSASSPTLGQELVSTFSSVGF